MYNSSYHNSIYIHTKKTLLERNSQQRLSSYRKVTLSDLFTWNIHLFWRLLCSKKTKSGLSHKIRQTFLRFTYYYVYFGFFFSNSKYVKSTDVYQYHKYLHQNSSSKYFFSLLNRSINWLENTSFPNAHTRLLQGVFFRDSLSVETIDFTSPVWWSTSCTTWGTQEKNKLIFLYYKKKHERDDCLYNTTGNMLDIRWCMEGQQLIHFYSFFYFLWKDFIHNVCYFIYPNMHIFGKKYKSQFQRAVFKIRNYYGQYKWFLFYFSQFLSVDLNLLDFFKRGVIQWTGYDSVAQKWFFVLNTLVSYRWSLTEAIRNDSLRRSQLIWKEDLFRCLDKQLGVSDSLSNEYKQAHGTRLYLSWESSQFWYTGDMKALLGIWKMCASFRDKVLQLKSPYWTHTKGFSQFRFKSGSSFKLVGKQRAKQLFYFKKVPHYGIGAQQLASQAAVGSRLKWKKDLFWNIKSRISLRKRLFDFVKRVRYNKEDLKQVAFTYFCNQYVSLRSQGQSFLMHKAILSEGYMQKKLEVTSQQLVPSSLPFGKRGFWAVKLLKVYMLSSKKSLKLTLLRNLCRACSREAPARWLTLLTWLVQSAFIHKEVLSRIQIKLLRNWALSSNFFSLIRRLFTWSLRVKKQWLGLSDPLQESKLFEKSYVSGRTWVVLCVSLWRYLILFLSKKVSRKMTFRLWRRFSTLTIKGLGTSWKLRSFLQKHIFFKFLIVFFKKSKSGVKKGWLFQNFVNATKWLWGIAKSRALFGLKEAFHSTFHRVKSWPVKQYETKKMSWSVDFFFKKLYLYNRVLRRKFKNKASKKKIKKWIRFRKKVRARQRLEYGIRTSNTEYQSIYARMNLFMASLFGWISSLHTLYSYKHTWYQFSKLHCNYYLFSILGLHQFNPKGGSLQGTLSELNLKGTPSYLYHTGTADKAQKDISLSPGSFHRFETLTQPIALGVAFNRAHSALSVIKKRHFRNGDGSWWSNLNSIQNTLSATSTLFQTFFFGLCQTFQGRLHLCTPEWFLLKRDQEYLSRLDAYPDFQYKSNIVFFQKWKSVSKRFGQCLSKYKSRLHSSDLSEKKKRLCIGVDSPKRFRSLPLYIYSDASSLCSESLYTYGILQRCKSRYKKLFGHQQSWLSRLFFQSRSLSVEHLTSFSIFNKIRFFSHSKYYGFVSEALRGPSIRSTSWSIYQRKRLQKGFFFSFCDLLYHLKYDFCILIKKNYIATLKLDSFHRDYSDKLGQYKFSTSLQLKWLGRSTQLSNAPWAYVELYRVGVFYKAFLGLARSLNSFVIDHSRLQTSILTSHLLGYFYSTIFRSLYHQAFSDHRNSVSSQSMADVQTQAKALPQRMLSQLRPSAFLFRSLEQKCFYPKFWKNKMDKWNSGFSWAQEVTSSPLYSMDQKNSISTPVYSSIVIMRQLWLHSYMRRSFKFWRMRYAVPGLRRQKLRFRFLNRYSQLFFQSFIWGSSAVQSGLKRVKYKQRRAQHFKKRLRKARFGQLKVFRAHRSFYKALSCSSSRMKAFFYRPDHKKKSVSLRKKAFYILKNISCVMHDLLIDKTVGSRRGQLLAAAHAFDTTEHKYLFFWKHWTNSCFQKSPMVFTSDVLRKKTPFLVSRKNSKLSQTGSWQEGSRVHLPFSKKQVLGSFSLSVNRSLGAPCDLYESATGQIMEPLQKFNQAKVSRILSSIQKGYLFSNFCLSRWSSFFFQLVSNKVISLSVQRQKQSMSEEFSFSDNTFFRQLQISRRLLCEKLKTSVQEVRLKSDLEDYSSLVEQSNYNLTSSNYIYFNFFYHSVYALPRGFLSSYLGSSKALSFWVYSQMLHSMSVIEPKRESFSNDSVSYSLGVHNTSIYVWSLKDYFSNLYEYLNSLRTSLQVRLSTITKMQLLRFFFFSKPVKTSYLFLKEWSKEVSIRQNQGQSIHSGWVLKVQVYTILCSLYRQFTRGAYHASKSLIANSLRRNHLTSAMTSVDKSKVSLAQTECLIAGCYQASYTMGAVDIFKAGYNSWVTLLSEIKKAIISHAGLKTPLEKLESWSFFSKYYVVFLNIVFTFFGKSFFHLLKWLEGRPQSFFITTHLFPLYRKYIFFLGNIEYLKWHTVLVPSFNVGTEWNALNTSLQAEQYSVLEEFYALSRPVSSRFPLLGTYGWLLFSLKELLWRQSSRLRDWQAKRFLCFYPSTLVSRYSQLCFFSRIRSVFNNCTLPQGGDKPFNVSHLNLVKFAWFFYQFFISHLYARRSGGLLGSLRVENIFRSQFGSRVRRLFKWINLFSFVFNNELEDSNVRWSSSNKYFTCTPKPTRTILLFLFTLWIRLWRMNSYYNIFSIQMMFLFRSYHKYLLLRYRESNFHQVPSKYDRQSLYIRTLYHFYVQFMIRKHTLLNKKASEESSHRSSHNIEGVHLKNVDKFSLLRDLLLAKRAKSNHTKRFWRRLYFFVARRVYNFLYHSEKPFLYTWRSKTHVSSLSVGRNLDEKFKKQSGYRASLDGLSLFASSKWSSLSALSKSHPHLGLGKNKGSRVWSNWQFLYLWKQRSFQQFKKDKNNFSVSRGRSNVSLKKNHRRVDQYGILSSFKYFFSDTKYRLEWVKRGAPSSKKISPTTF